MNNKTGASTITTLLIILFSLSCGDTKTDTEQSEGPDTVESHEPESRKSETYYNRPYHVKAELPDAWRVTSSGPEAPFPIINLYSSHNESQPDLPINIHSSPEATHISLYPQGYGTELLSGKKTSYADRGTNLPMTFDTDSQQSTVFQLESLEEYAYTLKPVSPPAGWNDEGFIMVKFGVKNYRTECYRTDNGEEIVMADCDPVQGDTIKVFGTINKELKKETLAILSTLTFTKEGEQKRTLNDLIKVDKPLPDQDITSPLTISGEARGMWYFEGSFHVILEDKDGAKLGQGIAEADGEWMTEDWVAFKATLTYDSKGDERGYLVFNKANPSGLKENSREYRLPVILK